MQEAYRHVSASKQLNKRRTKATPRERVRNNETEKRDLNMSSVCRVGGFVFSFF